jgi:formylglycine-generating enzyme required for sulfatase activity
MIKLQKEMLEWKMVSSCQNIALPTEAEWEYASYGLIGNTIGERITDRRIYPWNGHGVRNR